MGAFFIAFLIPSHFMPVNEPVHFYNTSKSKITVEPVLKWRPKAASTFLL